MTLQRRTFASSQRPFLAEWQRRSLASTSEGKLPSRQPARCRRYKLYFTATPEGRFSVVNPPAGVNPPEAGVMAYCETLPAVELATNSQLSSLRMAIEFGPGFVATVAGLSGVNAPVADPKRNPEIVLDPLFTTYKKLPYASTAIGPGRSPTG